MKKTFSIVVDGIDAEFYDNTIKAFHKEMHVKLPDVVAVHYDDSSPAEQLVILRMMVLAAALYIKRVYKKSTGGN